MTAPLRPTTLEIDLGAAADNLRAVRGLVGPSRSIFAVVKADGYGFGGAEVGAGTATPILVYPNSLPEAAAAALSHRLVPPLVDLESARAYSQAASGPCPVFVKADVALERRG